MIALITFFIFIYFAAKIDAEHYNKQEYVEDHSSRWFQRASVALILLTLDINLAIGFIFLFWTTFDATLNKLRGLDLWYIGTTANWDKFWQTKPLLYYKISKVIALLVALSILF
jgi:hypothetical protein